MKTILSTLIVTGLSLAATGTALAGEASLNGWGKAYAEAAAREKAGLSANAAANLNVRVTTPGGDGVRNVAERTRSGVQGTVEKTTGIVATTAERGRSAVETTVERVRGTAEGTVDRVRGGVNGVLDRAATELAGTARAGVDVQSPVNARVEVLAQVTAVARAAERPAISLFQNPGALVERPVAVERPAMVERPALIRPERLVSILR